jgi:hypothetical protein
LTITWSAPGSELQTSTHAASTRARSACSCAARSPVSGDRRHLAADQFAQFLLGGKVRGPHRLGRLSRLLDVHTQHLPQELLLGADVVVERAGAQAGPMPDFSHAGAVEPLRGEQFDRRSADARARLLGLLCAAPRAAPPAKGSVHDK